ncbi:helix-turn-helix transcriptional regulator [Streptomyces sp. NPDC054933]
MIERDEERARLTRFFTGRSDGRGRIGVISGAVGSGKTALLNHVSEHVTASGVRLLSAVAAPSEQGFPYAVLEQLLQALPPLADGLPPLLFPLPPEHDQRPGETPAGTEHTPQVPLTILRGFHRTLAELSAQEPLLITIDDVQFADAQSLTCLAYAIRRLPANRPSLLIACARACGTPTALRELGRQLDVRNVRLGALSERGVGQLLAERFDPADAIRIAPAFHAATGGNPLLVHGFLDDTPRPAPGTANRTPFTPKTGEMFRQSALASVHRSGQDSLLTAQGVAVLGNAEAVPLLCGLIGLDERTVRLSITALAEAGILDEPGAVFRHEAVRDAVLEDLPGTSVAQLRWRAARLLYDDGASPTAVAHQLIDHDVPAPHEEWVPQVLREAAHRALADDQVSFATRCLQTAERCCPDDKDRLAIRAELAEIIWRVKPSASVQQLQSLAAPARAGLLPPTQTLQLALGMMWNGQMDDAAAAIRQVNEVMSKAPDSRLGTELHAVRLLMASTYPDTLGKLQDSMAQVDGGGRGAATVAPSLRALNALQTSLCQDTDDATAAQAEQVLRTTRLTDLTRQPLKAALLALVYAERLGPATLWCDRFLAEAATRSAPSWLATFNAVRAQIALRRGHLGKAVECAEQALEQLPAHGWGVGIGMPLATLVEARTAMGHHDAAAELLDSPVPDAMFATRHAMHYLYARGRHQLATGRHHAALTDFAACGERMRAWGMDSAALVPWRLGAAETWLALDNHGKAAEWAEDQLARTSESQARIRGAAVRVLAATLPPVERPKLLGQAITALQTGGDCYEMARALADLGQAHKQLGEVAKGRLLIRRAWRMAEGCGAEELYRSLQPTPVRGASSEATGETAGAVRADTAAVASLTDAERRVASLAVYGYTNREIAAKLFITISTVEQHLTRVYRKINISHRQDLPVSLDSDVAHSA